MSATPENVVRHELVGLHVAVEDAANRDLIGVAGRVVRETHNTLVLEEDRTGRRRQVPKRHTTFVIELDDGTRVRVSGDRLVAPPARRSEQGGVSPWQ